MTPPVRGEAKVVVLDIDDTLYLERDYVRSGFDDVGRHVLEVAGVAGFGERCMALFEQGHRGSTFDVVAAELGVGGVSTAELVERYRSHEPRIELLPDAARFLRAAVGHYDLAVLTDGAPASQRAKIRALGLEEHVSCVVVTDELGGPHLRKPAPAGFLAVERAFPGRRPADFTYIADNPGKDFEGARAAGWQFLRLRRDLGLHGAVEDPDGCRTVGDLDEAWALLAP